MDKCPRCESIKSKHKDYNFCPYCGNRLNENAFVSNFKTKYEKLPRNSYKSNRYDSTLMK